MEVRRTAKLLALGFQVNEDPIVSRYVAEYNSKKLLSNLGYRFDGSELSQIDSEMFFLIEAGISDAIKERAKKGK